MPTHSSGISQGWRMPLRPKRPWVVAPLTRFGPPGPPAPEEGGTPGEGASGDGGGPGGAWVRTVGLLLHIGPRGDTSTISLSALRGAPVRRFVADPRSPSDVGGRRTSAERRRTTGAGRRAPTGASRCAQTGARLPGSAHQPA